MRGIIATEKIIIKLTGMLTGRENRASEFKEFAARKMALNKGDKKYNASSP